MRQLIETDERQLGALPLQDGLLMLEMRELDLGAGRKSPLQDGGERLAAGTSIELQALVPKAARVANLHRVAPEEDRREVRLAAVAERFQQ